MYVCLCVYVCAHISVSVYVCMYMYVCVLYCIVCMDGCYIRSLGNSNKLRT